MAASLHGTESASGRVWGALQTAYAGGGGDLVREETCLEKFSTPNSGAIFPITFNKCGAIFPILFFWIKFKICTLCWGGGYDRGRGVQN